MENTHNIILHNQIICGCLPRPLKANERQSMTGQGFR